MALGLKPLASFDPALEEIDHKTPVIKKTSFQPGVVLIEKKPRKEGADWLHLSLEGYCSMVFDWHEF